MSSGNCNAVNKKTQPSYQSEYRCLTALLLPAQPHQYDGDVAISLLGWRGDGVGRGGRSDNRLGVSPCTSVLLEL